MKKKPPSPDAADLSPDDLLATLWCTRCQERACVHLRQLIRRIQELDEQKAELIKRTAEVNEAVDFLFAAMRGFDKPDPKV